MDLGWIAINAQRNYLSCPLLNKSNVSDKGECATHNSTKRITSHGRIPWITQLHWSWQGPLDLSKPTTDACTHSYLPGSYNVLQLRSIRNNSTMVHAPSNVLRTGGCRRCRSSRGKGRPHLAVNISVINRDWITSIQHCTTLLSTTSDPSSVIILVEWMLYGPFLSLHNE